MPQKTGKPRREERKRADSGQADVPEGEPVDEDDGKAQPAPPEKGKKSGLKQRFQIMLMFSHA